MTQTTSIQTEFQEGKPFANVFLLGGELCGYQALNKVSERSGKYELRVDLAKQNAQDVEALQDVINQVANAATARYAEANPGFETKDISHTFLCIKRDKESGQPVFVARTADEANYQLLNADNEAYAGRPVFAGSVIRAALLMHGSIYLNEKDEVCLNVGAKPYTVKVEKLAENSYKAPSMQQSLGADRLDAIFEAVEKTSSSSDIEEVL